MSDGRSVLESLRIILRQAHVTLLVDCVVEKLIADEAAGHCQTIKIRIPEEQVQAHGSATAEAGYSNTVRIQVGPLLKKLANRCRLILRGVDADIVVKKMPPFPS